MSAELPEIPRAMIAHMHAGLRKHRVVGYSQIKVAHYLNLWPRFE